MFQKIKNFLSSAFDIILPPRTNFSIVRKLDEESISNLPRAPYVDGMDWIHPLFHYRDKRVKAVIWELKYRENTATLEHISTLMYEEIIGLLSDVATFDRDAEFLLIPIPITRDRRRERGYNQSEYIAKAIMEKDLSRTLLYAPQWFEKIKETQSQSHSQSRDERMKNLVGCFSADSRVEGKYIVLIDDVVTTGSTLSEARGTLLSSGVRDVFAFTIAH